SGVELHDFGTTFKAYRSEVLKDVNLYGELHRFIPALAMLYGARIAEVPTKNTPRIAGGAHYGLGRTFPRIFHLITIKFLLSYLPRPMHLFGKLGLGSMTIGASILAYLLIYKLFGHHIMLEHGPLMMAGALMLMTGVTLVCTGLLGEVLTRIYFE